MKLTVISAAYNVLASVGLERMTESIRSVAALPIEHEHLVFDGASTDGTVEALRKLEAEIPSLKVVSEPDSGIYDALNKGLRAAKGEFFYVLGMDDVIIGPTELGEIVNAAIDGRYDMFVAQMIGEGARHSFPRKINDAYGEFNRNSYGHQGVIVRTELARSEEIGLFDTSYRIAADYKQLLLLHWHGARVGMASKLFALFADTGVSSTSGNASRMEAWRAKKEVYGLTDLEFAAMKATGKLPLRVAKHFIKSGSDFSRKMGLKCLLATIWRKHKSEVGSAYYCFGIPIFKHSRNEVGK